MTEARRGRVAKGPDPAAGPVPEFAHGLWELKRAAGDPSYDRMRDELGALASKSALSAAARGDRLPSWETAWEFVRVLAVGVLGEDVERVRHEWRGRWERAQQPAKESVVEAVPVEQPRKRWWPVIGVAAVVALVLAGGLVLVLGQEDPPDQATPAAPIVDGDASEYVSDVTLQDGARVPTDTQVIKTWEIRNSGTVPWVGRVLRREGAFGDPDECVTPPQVPVPDTAPGQTVRVSVDVRTPSRPGHCHVYWKMADAQGRLLLPGNRGLYFLLTIDG
ncbi:NBR1-Ig-like domain-containing protein [Amycolatopsis sp. 195334CR]|uniref:NBR1-Ig-like domain-containing protein n=1 Tax=Amycolatopsis sp. 195334CR TaxID=2814588 RepID=UPI001A901F52|nr:NBR1-Ig-like domain-containing protein [Amycolatopsis sp. 195334CR]MBN6034577.1 transcriptional regulator [Amycolatopsis sp. 195334CR]